MNGVNDKFVKHLTPPPGVQSPHYPAFQDKIYRIALITFVLSMAVHMVALAGGWSGLDKVAIGATSLALLVAAWTFLVWLPRWRWIVRIGGTLAFALWLRAPGAAWEVILLTSAIIAAKEHHCFQFWSGRYIPWAALAVAIQNVLGGPAALSLTLWIVLVWLWVPLIIQRMRLPLFEV